MTYIWYLIALVLLAIPFAAMVFLPINKSKPVLLGFFLVFIVSSPSWIGDVSQLIGVQALCTAVLFIEGITQPRTTAFMNIVESAEEICIFAFVAIGFSATGS